MPHVNLRTQVTLTLWVDCEADIAFGDPGGTYAVEGFKITGVDGVTAKTAVEFVNTSGGTVRLPVTKPVFSPDLHEAILPLVEDELLAEAKR